MLRKLPSEAGIPASPITSKKDGPYELRGTFIVKELVYAYAMWISPAFHLKVIRAYDAMVSGELFDTGNRLAKATRVYFERHPKDRAIRMHAEQGFPYWWIAQKVGRCAGTVGKAVARMVRWVFSGNHSVGGGGTGIGFSWSTL